MKKAIPLLILSLFFVNPQKLNADPVPPPLAPLHDDLFSTVVIHPLEESANIPSERVQIHIPQPSPKFVEIKASKALTSNTGFSYDNEVSWYGPGLYGNRTACGKNLSTTILGVAHRTLPCGTLVDFRYQGITIRAEVIDRGPFVAGRQWDLTGGLCTALNHCFTGAIEYKVVR